MRARRILAELDGADGHAGATRTRAFVDFQVSTFGGGDNDPWVRPQQTVQVASSISVLQAG